MTRAWVKVTAVDALVKKNARIYRRAHHAMVSLGAVDNILSQHRSLSQHDLKVTAVVADPNARGHRNDTLAWFWTMDIPGDTDMNDWMSECELDLIPLVIFTDGNVSLPRPLASG